MNWITTWDSDFVNLDKVTDIRLEIDKEDDENYVVNVYVENSNNRKPRRLFVGEKSECTDYMDWLENFLEAEDGLFLNQDGGNSERVKDWLSRYFPAKDKK